VIKDCKLERLKGRIEFEDHGFLRRKWIEDELISIKILTKF